MELHAEGKLDSLYETIYPDQRRQISRQTFVSCADNLLFPSYCLNLAIAGTSAQDAAIAQPEVATKEVKQVNLTLQSGGVVAGRGDFNEATRGNGWHWVLSEFAFQHMHDSTCLLPPTPASSHPVVVTPTPR